MGTIETCQRSIFLPVRLSIVNAGHGFVFSMSATSNAGSSPFCVKEIGSVTSTGETIINQQSFDHIESSVLSISDVLSCFPLIPSVSVHSVEWVATVTTIVRNDFCSTLISNMILASESKTI